MAAVFFYFCIAIANLLLLSDKPAVTRMSGTHKELNPGSVKILMEYCLPNPSQDVFQSQQWSLDPG